MHNTLKIYQRALKLPYLCMRLLERLDFSLTALERIIFLRFLLRYGLNKTSKKDLKTVAEKIGIRLPTLKKTITVLLEKGVLCDVGDGHFRISMKLLRLVLATSKARRTYSKFVRSNYKVERPKVDFLIQLFHLLFRIRISHKQKNVHQLLQLNYQQWLVLLNMVWRSDLYGLVSEASTHELANHTGMSRSALLRAITGLFEFGILRAKINGSLNHNLLRSVSAVYFLNLSHPIWGDSRIYADYYILRFPAGYQSVTQQAFNFIQTLHDQNQKAMDFTPPEDQIQVLKYDPDMKIYQRQSSYLTDYLFEKYQLGMTLDPEFSQQIQLLSPKFKASATQLNCPEDNLQRINLLLQNYWQQRGVNSLQIQFPHLLLNAPQSRWFWKNLHPIVLSSEAQKKFKQKQINLYQIKDALDEIRDQILLQIAQVVFESEIFPLFQQRLEWFPELCDSQHALKSQHFAMLGSGLAQQQIYYQLKPKSQQEDRFFLMEFVMVNGSSLDSNYQLRCKSIDLDADQQKAYGLLDPRFKTLTIHVEKTQEQI